MDNFFNVTNKIDHLLSETKSNRILSHYFKEVRNLVELIIAVVGEEFIFGVI